MTKKNKLETTFHIHHDLKKTLQDMQKYCPISKKLLSIQSTDELSKYVNYIGISQDNNSFISYVDDKRYLACLDKKYKRYKFVHELKQGDKVKLNSQGLIKGSERFPSKLNGRNTLLVNRVDTDKTVNLQFKGEKQWFNFDNVIPVNKVPDFYVPNIRYHMSCVKFTKRLFGDEFTEQQYSDFCSMFKVYHPSSDYLDRYSTEFVKGEKIQHWYCEDTYSQTTDSLGNSCMRYSKCRPWLQIYADNPETIEMFIVKDENGLVGRCLIWGHKYFDRVYGVNNDVTVAIISYLRGRDFIDIYNNQKSIEVNFTLNYGYTYYDHFPYMDTFRSLCGKTIYNHEDKDADRVLTSSDGKWNGYEEDEQVQCDVDGSRYDQNECYYYDEWDIYVHESNVVYCARRCRHYPQDRVQKLYNGDYDLTDDTVELWDGNYASDNDCDLMSDIDGDYFIHGYHKFVEVDDEWYPESDDRICCVDGKYYLTEDCVEIDDEWYLKENCYYSEKHGWTLKPMEEEIETENPLQLKLFECKLTESCS